MCGAGRAGGRTAGAFPCGDSIHDLCEHLALSTLLHARSGLLGMCEAGSSDTASLASRTQASHSRRFLARPSAQDQAPEWNAPGLMEAPFPGLLDLGGRSPIHAKTLEVSVSRWVGWFSSMTTGK
jgi:hypothetical protein